MSIPLRAVLILASAAVLVIVLRKIRKSGLEISDSIFWIGLSFLLFLVAVFPQVAYWASGFLGFDAPSNFVFFCGIVILLARTFTQDRKIAILKKKLTTLAQTEALSRK